MKVLALELSSARGSLAWLSGEDTVARDWPNDRKNSGAFFENLLALRQQFGLPDTIVVGLGPGSYAGVRIAISAAIGLHASSDTRLLGYPSICAMEADGKDYCVIGDARRQSFFYARIRANKLAEGPTLVTEKELQDKLARLSGEISVLAAQHLPQFERALFRYPSASILARLALDSGCAFARPPLEPIYLRDPFVTMPGSNVQPKFAS
jgi:tRNA threonylcarbamoyladenosine biosynthesis protein TsaB